MKIKKRYLICILFTLVITFFIQKNIEHLSYRYLYIKSFLIFERNMMFQNKNIQTPSNWWIVSSSEHAITYSNLPSKSTKVPTLMVLQKLDKKTIDKYSILFDIDKKGIIAFKSKPNNTGYFSYNLMDSKSYFILFTENKSNFNLDTHSLKDFAYNLFLQLR
jgi:hypothetical protein